MLKKISNLILSLSFMVLSGFSLLSAGSAGDEDLGERLGEISTSVSAIGDFIMLIIGLVGVVILLLAFMKLKANADDDRQNNMKTVIIYFIVGAGLTAFSAIQLMLGNTLGESDTERTGSDDFKAGDLGS